MIRKVTVSLLSLLLSICLVIPAFAQTAPYIVDEADLLWPEEITLLEQKASQIKEHYAIDAVILTVDTLNGYTAYNFADEYYIQTGYSENGILFLLAMEEKEWYISTNGSLIYALTDYGIQLIGEETVSYFADDRWYDGFYYFLDTLPSYLEALESGHPIDGYAEYSSNYYHGNQEEVIYYTEETTPSFLLSLICGIVVSGIVLLIMRYSMNTKRQQRGASVYMKEGSWKLTQHRDVFLYSNVTKTRKQEPPKSSGGGSSVHRSSSGRRHGGGGGKF